MRRAVVFEARREGYGIDQFAHQAMTVGELKELLEDIEDDALFVLSHDSGYTYGSIDARDATVYQEQEDGEWTQEW